MSQSPFKPREIVRQTLTPQEQEAELIAQLRRGPKPYVPRAKSIRSIVKNWTIRRDVSAEQTSLLTQQQWQAAVGELLSPYTRPGHIRRGALFVIVDSPLVLQELKLREKQILQDLQTALPEHGIKSLRFKVE